MVRIVCSRVLVQTHVHSTFCTASLSSADHELPVLRGSYPIPGRRTWNYTLMLFPKHNVYVFQLTCRSRSSLFLRSSHMAVTAAKSLQIMLVAPSVVWTILENLKQWPSQLWCTTHHWRGNHDHVRTMFLVAFLVSHSLALVSWLEERGTPELLRGGPLDGVC